MQFARDFVLKAPFTRPRSEMLEAGQGLRGAEAQARRSSASTRAIARAGRGLERRARRRRTCSWTPASRPARHEDAPPARLLEMVLTGENKGTEPLKRVRALDRERQRRSSTAASSSSARSSPGEKKSWKVQVRLPKDLTTPPRRRDGEVLRRQRRRCRDTLVSELSFVELPRPAFAFNWQVLDDCDELQRRRRRAARRGRHRCCWTSPTRAPARRWTRSRRSRTAATRTSSSRRAASSSASSRPARRRRRASSSR